MVIRHHIKNTLYRVITGFCAGMLVLFCIAASEICAEDRNLFAISAKDLHTLQKPLADYDADQLVRYLGHAIKGISDPTIVKKITIESPAVKIPHDQDIRTNDFHFSRFMISHNFHKGKEINRRTVGGILLFEDQYCRTISMAFDTEYSVMPWGDIIIYSAAIRPVNAPILPVCKLFFVPAGNISQSILKTRNFTALLDHVVNNALDKIVDKDTLLDVIGISVFIVQLLMFSCLGENGFQSDRSFCFETCHCHKIEQCRNGIK